MDVKSYSTRWNRIRGESTVTINCHAVRFVCSHLPLLPLSIFFSAAATAGVVVMVSFLFVPCHTYCQEVLAARKPVPLPTMSIQAQAGGLAFAPGGSATNDAMSIPTAQTCFRSRGGSLSLERQQFCGTLAVIAVVTIITNVVAIVVVIVFVIVAITITIAITVIAGCYHCHKDNKFLTGFIMSHVFLQPQTGDHQQRLCQRTEDDGSGKPKAWEVACGFA